MALIHDSVFTPALRFADDLLMPIAEIEAAQQRVEDAATAAMMTAIEEETQSLLRRVEQALVDGDVSAINMARWPLAGRLARAIAGLWGQGFGVGAEQGLEEMRSDVEDVRPFLRRFALADDARRVLTLEPQQLVNTDAVDAVMGRANLLAGNFSDDVFGRLKGDLIAAIVPQPGTGEPISRDDLLKRIQGTLGVGENRAKNIAVTETTYAYNTGRMSSFNQSELVDYVRVIPILDSRTTDICRSRAGLVVPKDQLATIGGLPPWHSRCRTTIGAVMSQLSRFKAMVADPANDPANRAIAPLPTGWRTSSGAAAAAPTARWPTQLPVNHVVSDDPKITRDRLDEALNTIAGKSADAAERVGKFRRFAEAHGMQAVFRDQSMTAKQAAANRWQILDQLDDTNSKVVQLAKQRREWLRNNRGHSDYNRIRRETNKFAARLVDNIPGAGGYTYMDTGRHITVKVDTRNARDWDTVTEPRLSNWANNTLNMSDVATERSQLMSVTGAGFQSGDPVKTLGVYFHESGHQVHAVAGRPTPLDNMILVTDYAFDDDLEMVAESFALYMMDGDRYRQSDPVGYDWITNLLDTALNNQSPTP